MVSDSGTLNKGFSLVELLIATAITIGTGAVAFQLLHQDERIFRDQILIVEMHQAARMLANQILDDVRLAGQGVPPGIGGFVLSGSNSSRVNMRQTTSALETQVTTFLPFTVNEGTPVTLGVEKTTGFSAGREIYVWGGSQWLRGSILFVSGPAKTLRIQPTRGSNPTVTFEAPPCVTPDEAVALFYDAGASSVRRATSENTTDPQRPVWSPANEIATHVTTLAFSYFDASGNLIDMQSAAATDRVFTIETRIRVQASEVLTDGTRPAFALTVRGSPRNLQLQ